MPACGGGGGGVVELASQYIYSVARLSENFRVIQKREITPPIENREDY